jgi:RNA polymerase sigma factor (TIGR02999 family)
MGEAVQDQITLLLQQMQQGDSDARAKLASLVYPQLKKIAAQHMRCERPDHTLQPTALVHEAYLRVSQIRKIDWQNRGHFIAIVTSLMRRILVDHARARRAAKRDGALEGELPISQEPRQLDTLAVDQALVRMSERYPRCAQIVEFRFFGDLDFQEIAEVMNLSLTTVERDWRFARAWLQKKMASSIDERR